MLIDIAAGYCDFINNIKIPSDNAANDIKKFAFDANPDVSKWASDDVNVIIDDIENIGNHFEKDSVSVCFMSNFLEHIDKKAIVKLLADIKYMLKDNGELWILTPNVKYVGGKYWDFFDHITPITEDALIEQAESMGYKNKRLIRRFLPFSTKSKLPQWQWLVSLYLKLMPLSGFLFGEQSFLVFQK